MRTTSLRVACFSFAVIAAAACFGNSQSSGLEEPEEDLNLEKGGVGFACSDKAPCRPGLVCGSTSGRCELGRSIAEGQPCILNGEGSAGLYCGLGQVCAARDPGEPLRVIPRDRVVEQHETAAAGEEGLEPRPLLARDGPALGGVEDEHVGGLELARGRELDPARDGGAAPGEELLPLAEPRLVFVEPRPVGLGVRARAQEDPERRRRRRGRKEERQGEYAQQDGHHRSAPGRGAALATASPAAPSILRNLLGSAARSGGAARTRLLLCGSAVRFMGGLLGGQAPLRGRAGLEIVVPSFDYPLARQFAADLVRRARDEDLVLVDLDRLYGGS